MKIFTSSLILTLFLLVEISTACKDVYSRQDYEPTPCEFTRRANTYPPRQQYDYDMSSEEMETSGTGSSQSNMRSAMGSSMNSYVDVIACFRRHNGILYPVSCSDFTTVLAKSPVTYYEFQMSERQTSSQSKNYNKIKKHIKYGAPKQIAMSNSAPYPVIRRQKYYPKSVEDDDETDFDNDNYGAEEVPRMHTPPFMKKQQKHYMPRSEGRPWRQPTNTPRDDDQDNPIKFRAWSEPDFDVNNRAADYYDDISVPKYKTHQTPQLAPPKSTNFPLRQPQHPKQMHQKPKMNENRPQPQQGREVKPEGIPTEPKGMESTSPKQKEIPAMELQ